MAQIFNYIYIGVAVVLLFGAAIFFHEFGHFWMARRRGLKVLEFSIGFGPKMYGWTKDGIDYSIRWIPAGGYVKLPQMVTSSAIEGSAPEGEPLPPVTPLSKILVAAAGPFMNVVFAFVIATVIYFVGLPVLINPSVIGEVDPKSEEAKLGIHPGDKIVAVNGTPVKSWQEVFNITMLSLTNVLPVAIEQDGKTNVYQLQTEVKEINNAIKVKVLKLESRDHVLVKNVLPGNPAEAAGLKARDEIIGFAGLPVTSREQFVNLVQKRGGLATAIEVKRGDEVLSMTVKPTLGLTPKIGIEFDGKDYYQMEYPTPWAQIDNVWDQMCGTFNALIHSRQSGVKASDLSGPVGILGGLAIQVNTNWRLALNFLVLLNVNLGLLNLLPLPVLDGGHILMSIIERIRRKPIDIRIVEYTTTAFAVLLISFMLYVTFFDIKRIPILKSLFNHESHIEKVIKPAPASTNTAQ